MNKLKIFSIMAIFVLFFTNANVKTASAKEVITTNLSTANLSSNGPTDSHQRFAGQALKILTNDKGSDVARSLNEHMDLLLEYCDMPDNDEDDYVFAYHFYNPITKINYLPRFMNASNTTAMTKFQEHIENAVNNYNSDRIFAIEELGRALHFLEDINVPHHAANLVAGLSSHSQYEAYISNNNELFFTNTSNSYDKYANYEFNDFCVAIFDECAENAYSYKDLANTYDDNNWNYVATETLKVGQENMAALLYRFMRYVEK